MKDKDGTKIYCRINAKLIRNKNGDPEKIIGAILDTTQLHKTLHDLKTSESKFNGRFMKT